MNKMNKIKTGWSFSHDIWIYITFEIAFKKFQQWSLYLRNNL